jgi:hypothetical protein
MNICPTCGRPEQDIPAGWSLSPEPSKILMERYTQEQALEMAKAHGINDGGGAG